MVQPVTKQCMRYDKQKFTAVVVKGMGRVIMVKFTHNQVGEWELNNVLTRKVQDVVAKVQFGC